MKYNYFILFLLTISTCFSQLPDYSNLTKKEKLSYMNAYGFVVLKTGDTILAKVNYEYAYNKPKISDENELRLKYPKYLKRYAYKKKIPLAEVEKFYFGSPPLYQIVKKHRSQFINLEVIELGKYNIYRRKVTITNKNKFYYSDTNTPMSHGGTTIIEALYIEKGEGPLINLYNDKEDKDYDFLVLKDIFNSDLTDQEIKKLIKGNSLENINTRIIEVVHKLNQE